MRVAVSEVFICMLLPFLCPAFLRGPVGFSSDISGVKAVATRGVFLPLAVAVHNVVESSGDFWVILDCTMSLL